MFPSPGCFCQRQNFAYVIFLWVWQGVDEAEGNSYLEDLETTMGNTFLSVEKLMLTQIDRK